MNASHPIALCRVLTALLWGLLLAGCASLPSLEGREMSWAISEAEARETRLGRGLFKLTDSHPGLSGIHSLLDAHDAFAARMSLARAAERSLDIQYYIWRNDMTGTLLFEALHAAADRGVRVRLLLDDNNTKALDSTLAILDSHANIEVRLFNPFLVRSVRTVGFITDFSRANRRMHNKSWTVDNLATIVGGRNIGDEYFGADDILFTDLDVLAVGAVVRDVSQDFDRYWGSASAYPAALILPDAPEEGLALLAAASSLVERDPAAAAYVEALRASRFVTELVQGRLNFEWAKTRLVSDSPAKGLGRTSRVDRVTGQIAEAIEGPTKRMDMVSPYFVPTERGVASFVALADAGVKVRVLTNSLDATDVAAVHSGYARYRKALLKAGVTLYEMRRLGPEPEERPKAGPFGSSGSSLHAKTFAVDGRQLFIGSFNFDPRSARLNTELGFVIDSPALTRRLHRTFDRHIPPLAYQVLLDENGRLYWLEQHKGREIRHRSEPRTPLWKRAKVWILSLLPIESLL